MAGEVRESLAGAKCGGKRGAPAFWDQKRKPVPQPIVWLIRRERQTAVVETSAARPERDEYGPRTR